ncbi:SEC-C metal-binding domain-containing protein [Azospirillum rugosum]|uniref:SEC-C motif-containing protein n=1 Tax=Azospirillum rugosum TaxID=416170 RepID=A0ABS4SYW8_9PROT|nr:SEC-C metal-binding domain-containing protein [Azospirillum rugosum]MBP2296590.1 hypothetical protein [Azospirillum rugosum]MDQ0530351.1 hypothetical protein [Azospirillum rugosum]
MDFPPLALNSSTPKAVTNIIEEFCRSIAPAPPVFVPVVPEPTAVVSECFPNVAAKVERDGGEIAYGWSIWEWPGVFIEAEHHAVWRSPTGDLIDVTPRPEREKKVLFVPDPETVYDWESNRRIDNRRLAIADDPYLREFLENAAEMAAFMERKSVGLTVSFNPAELFPLASRQQVLLNYLAERYGKKGRGQNQRRVGRNDPCPCGSGKKFKKCHGND